ncbi:Fibroblast growth factor receptor-like 1 [Orchesella cincta]|uniref:Fibroblast growth factor receptor-like 1 n=1 Tax=Orchesella cincta TaxID=48709 RepID=A0A1D2MQ75_ORCCI|nr:Fibroblast growth factor receptor-like 1 [Orchesella cincta]
MVMKQQQMGALKQVDGCLKLLGSHFCQFSSKNISSHDDPYENVLQRSEYTKSAPPYSEPEILKETDVHEGHIGENILLKCEANGNPRPLVSWKRGSQNYTHPTEGFSILKINNVTQDDAGGYKCEAINIFGRVIQDVTVKVRGPLQGSSEIIDIAPRNVTLYEGNQGNLTCIARFEGDPWFGWVKRIENKTEEINAFHYEGNYYSVLPRTDIRPLGQKLFATTLLLQNVTLANSGVYHCIVADPSKLHLAQIRRHKTVAILWIFSFLIFAALVILCIVRIYGCPSANKTKKSTQGTSSTTSSIMKTQLPKRSPETLSTDCTHPRHEVFAPLVTHGSCSLASQEPSVMFKDCNSSCRTFNSYDPEFSLPSSTDSFIIADLEAARSSYSHAESCDSKVCSKQSVTSPRTQTSDYYKRGQARKQSYHDRRGPHYHRHRHNHHHLYHPRASESPQSRFYDVQALNSHPSTPECCSYYAHNQSNLSISSDSESQWNSEPDHLAPEDQSYFLEDEQELEHPHYNSRSGRRKLNPSPNLSFLEQLKANPNTVTAIL